MASVNVENLCVRLGSSEIIHNLSLEVQDREFLVLLGPSGCGKSTFSIVCAVPNHDRRAQHVFWFAHHWHTQG